MAIPSATIADQNAPRPGKVTAQALDVRLQPSGQLRGRMLTADGQPIAGAEIHAYRNGHVVARAVSDRQGYFVVARLSGGVYQLRTEFGGGVYRLWPSAAAPPSAKPSVLLVERDVVRGQSPPHNPYQTRGQNGLGTGLYGGALTNTLSNPWVVSGLLATGIAVPIAVSDDDDEGS